jgi:inosine-uridine nucleoside N-ribohydrolase
MIPVVLDTDIGGDIDDTWALAMLLGCPELDLRLVVTATGDTTYRAQIAAGILGAAGRSFVPVGVGIPTALHNHVVPRPQSRFADEVDLARHPGGVHHDGVAALVECVMSSDEPLTIIAIGPLTNIAAALEAEPRIAERARLVAMLGSVHNAPFHGTEGPVPEYNVVADIPACRAAFCAGWEKTITPLDTCGWVVLRGAHYKTVRKSTSPLIRAVMRNYQEWVEAWSQAGEEYTAVFDRLDEALGDTNGRDDRPFWQRSSTVLFDTVAVYLAYAESLLNIETLPIALDDEGVMRITPGAADLRVATSWRDQGGFNDHLVQRLGA